jgi:tetratricopeptide (TPR) repeat protein
MSQQTERTWSAKNTVNIISGLLGILGNVANIIEWVSKRGVVCLPSWGIWLAECLLIASFIVSAILSCQKIRWLRLLRRSLRRHWKYYAVSVAVPVVCLIALTLVTVRWVIPWCQLSRSKATHPFWVTVADLHTAEEDTLSGGLRSDLHRILVEEHRPPSWLSDGKRSDLHVIPAPLPRAWVGRVCKTFKAEVGVHERVEQCRQNSNAAILLYGWLSMIRPAEDSVGMEAWFAIDKERLPLRALNVKPELTPYTEPLTKQINIGLALPVSFADVMTYTHDVQFAQGTQRAQVALVFDTFRECVTLFGAGLAYHMEGEQVKAIEFFEAASRPEQGCPNPAMILVFEGNAKAESGDLGGAATAFERAIEANPLLASAYMDLSTVYLATGKVDEAANTLEQLVQLQPDNADAYYNLGYAHFALEQWDPARNAWERALQLNPGYTSAWRNLGFLESSIHYQAMLPAEGWTTEDVLLPFAFRNLGAWYLDAHISNQAIEYYQLALKNTSDYTPERLPVQLHFEMGLAYGQQGQIDGLEDEWALIDLEPRDIFLRFSNDEQDRIHDILGADVFNELKQEYAPPAEVGPEPPEVIMPPEMWFEPLRPLTPF